MSDRNRRGRVRTVVSVLAGASRVVLLLCCCCAALQAAEPVSFRVEGLEGKALENVQAALALPPGLVRNGKIEKPWLDRLVRQAPQTVGEALQPFGYFEPQVRTERKTEDGSVVIVVHVDPGEPVRVDEVRVNVEGDGAQAPQLRGLVDHFPLRKGDILRQDEYERAKGALQSRAQDLGYLDARFPEHTIRVNRGEHRADIDLVLDTGPRYYFDGVTVQGAPTYPDRFLRRYVAFRTGDPFSYAKLGETQLNFRDSDRFKEIIISPEKDKAEEQRIPVGITLTPSAPKRLRPGIGYGTDTGPRLTIRYKDVNVFHRGHEYDANFFLSPVRQTLDTTYAIPSYSSLKSLTSFTLSLKQEDTDTYTIRSVSGEIERVRTFGPGKKGSVYLRVLYEDDTIAGAEESSFVVLPGVRYSQRRYSGKATRPRKAYQYALEVRGTHQALGSDTSFVQFLASGNAVVPLPGRFSTLLRLDTAYTEKNDPLKTIPVSLRFFAGGDQSVRGYAYQSLGPKDVNGKVTGGRNLLVGSVELDRAIGRNWGVAAFYDAGNAFNSPAHIHLYQGAGIGLRYYTIVGPIRVDLARQLYVPHPSYRLHFSLGVTF